MVRVGRRRETDNIKRERQRRTEAMFDIKRIRENQRNRKRHQRGSERDRDVEREYVEHERANLQVKSVFFF